MALESGAVGQPRGLEPMKEAYGPEEDTCHSSLLIGAFA